MNVVLNRLPEPVLIVGAYGYRNLGDEAILSGLLAKIGPLPLTVVSRDPADTARLHGVPAIGIRAAPGALLRHRSLVIGGGGLFGRDMGRIGRLLPVYGMTALALGRTVAIEGVDLDSDLAPSARVLVPALMRGAARVTVRDWRSAGILESWGVPANVAPDASAWMWPATPDVGRRLLQAAGVDLGRPVVGLALSAVEPGAGERALAAVAEAMDALPDVQFCFLPMSRHPSVAAHDDLQLALRLRSLRPRLLVLEQTPHPADMLAAIGQLSAMVGMRYHSMLFADRAAVPLVPMVYAEKNLRWLEERRIPSVEPSAGALVAALWAALSGDERAAFRIAPIRELVPAR